MKRRDGPVRRILGDRGSPQRRRLQTLPFAGPALILAVNSYRRARDFRRRKEHEWQNAFGEFKERHGMPRY
jgi:hypothetical protein